MHIFDTNSTQRTRIIAVTKPQEFVAYGITSADTISIDIALIGSMPSNFAVQGCSVIDSSNREVPIEGTAPYVVCGCTVKATSKSPRFVVSRPGVYIITFTGPSFGDAIVDAQEASPAAISEFSASCAAVCDECVDSTWSQTGLTRCSGNNIESEEKSNCGNSRWTVTGAVTWVDTGSTRCTNFVLEKQQINDCGSTKWVATATNCGYCPSLPVSCDGQSGFGYHVLDPKDPAATVEMAPCAGDASVDALWIYPTAGPGHTVKITDCDGALIGYAVNKSDCAPECGCQKETVVKISNNFSPTTNVAAPSVTTNVAAPAVTNNFAPTTNVAAPDVSVTLPAPNIVAHQFDADGVLTSTLSNGDTVESNPLPSC